MYVIQNSHLENQELLNQVQHYSYGKKKNVFPMQTEKQSLRSIATVCQTSHTVRQKATLY